MSNTVFRPSLRGTPISQLVIDSSTEGTADEEFLYDEFARIESGYFPDDDEESLGIEFADDESWNNTENSDEERLDQEMPEDAAASGEEEEASDEDALHRAINQAIKSCQVSLWGRALQFAKSTESIRDVLNAYAAHARNKFLNDSDWQRVLRDHVTTIWKRYLYSGIDRSWLGGDDLWTLTRVSRLEDLENFSALQRLWYNTNLILLASEGRNINGHFPQDFLIVHSIVKLNCPTIVLWFALRLFPEQIRTRDHLGRLPLHYAATKIPKPSSLWAALPRGVPQEIIEELRKPVISFLLERYAQGAGIADNGGRLPIHFATSNILAVHFFRQTVLPLGLQSAPETLAIQDPETGLFPYQQVAATGAPVGLIYDLLRAEPMVLKHQRCV